MKRIESASANREFNARSLSRRELLKTGFAVLLSAGTAVWVKAAGDYLGRNVDEHSIEGFKRSIPSPEIGQGTADKTPLLQVPVLQSGAATPSYPPGFNAHTDARVNRPLRPEDPPGLRINPVDGKEFFDR